MNKKLGFIGIVLVLLLISFVSASKVGYIYRSKSRIDFKVVDVFTEMGLKTDFISENNLQNLSQYNFIYVGDESFTKVIPIEDYNSLVSNYYLGEKSGITDSDGISKLASRHNLNVNIYGKLLPVYTEFVDERGIAIPYYFLDDDNKADGFKRYVGTDTTSSGNPFGDVISFGEKGLTLENGKINKGYICFFGIVKSQYWTEEARDLLKECVNFVNKPLNVVEPVIICNNDFQCNDNNIKTIDKCLNSGTTFSSCSNDLVRCNINSDCDDRNSSTEDVCLNSGLINSICVYNFPGKINVSLFAVPFETSVQLSFFAISSDGSKIKGYWISKDRNEWLWTISNNYTFNGLNASTSYNFYVKAEDILNRTSDEVNVLIITLSPVVQPVVSSGGSGGGGGQVNGLCLTQWNCSFWSECKNSQQIRNCSYNPNYYCYPTAPKPIEKQSCIELLKTNVKTALLPVEENKGENITISGSVDEESEPKTGELAPITGGVIGVIGDHPIWFVLGFLAIIAGVYGFLKFRK